MKKKSRKRTLLNGTPSFSSLSVTSEPGRPAPCRQFWTRCRTRRLGDGARPLEASRGNSRATWCFVIASTRPSLHTPTTRNPHPPPHLSPAPIPISPTCTFSPRPNGSGVFPRDFDPLVACSPKHVVGHVLPDGANSICAVLDPIIWSPWDRAE